jgi:hypothetical protein
VDDFVNQLVSPYLTMRALSPTGFCLEVNTYKLFHQPLTVDEHGHLFSPNLANRTWKEIRRMAVMDFEGVVRKLQKIYTKLTFSLAPRFSISPRHLSLSKLNLP